MSSITRTAASWSTPGRGPVINHLLDHAPVWITRAELEVSTTEASTVPEWAAVESARLRLAVDGEVIADEVTVLHTPGHTPGHLSVMVETDEGREMIVGQACYTCAEFEATITTLGAAHAPEWH